MASTTPLLYEGIYLLHEERFIETNRNIYKIGRSNNIYKRVSSYENGTIVYLMVACNDSESIESELIKIFNEDFEGIKYYGNEYFMGELEAMKDTIIEYIKSTTNDTIKLIDMDIKIETVDKETDMSIPKYQQELYSKAKLSLLNINNDYGENEDTEFKDCVEDINQPIIDNSQKVKNYTINNNASGNITINNYESDRICPCGMSFPYPSQLKRHQNSKLGCIPYMQYVQSHNTPITSEPYSDIAEPIKNSKEFLCKFCNKKFSTKFNQERHYNTCKANQQKSSQNLDISNIIEKFMNSKTNNKDLIFKIDKNGNTQISICKNNDLINNTNNL